VDKTVLEHVSCQVRPDTSYNEYISQELEEEMKPENLYFSKWIPAESETTHLKYLRSVQAWGAGNSFCSQLLIRWRDDGNKAKKISIHMGYKIHQI
jgi:S-adenosylmethionine:tRNA-ribosyltransferase-isomerase (queuine synthetase)